MTSTVKAEEFRVTDWILFARQRPGGVGQLWYSTPEGPSFVYIWMFIRGGDRYFQFASDAEGEHVVDFEGHLRVALREFLKTVPAVKAPVLSITPGSEMVMPEPHHFVKYVCPFCGGEHTFVSRPGLESDRPSCGGLLGPLDSIDLPPVFIGEPLDQARYDSGSVLIRLSTTMKGNV